ncbi:S-layer homology domain-containing protein [Cohnella endophytica]|nr:S-layer homology domain-containing protein [Cohnella endophytica]
MQGWIRPGKPGKISTAVLVMALFVSSVLAGFGSGAAYAQDDNPAQQTVKWFQNFELPGTSGKYGIASVGSASSAAAVSSKTASEDSKKSVRLIQTNENNPEGGAWDTGVYGFTAVPHEDALEMDEATHAMVYDASEYAYFSFYILDADEHNPNVVFKDADGRAWNAPTDGIVSVKNEWTRLSIPLDKSQIDFSRLVSVSLGEYWGWGNQYYFDELYFAKSASDLPPAYPPSGPDMPAEPMMFQSFEEPGQDGTYGLAGQGSATTASTTASPTAYSSSGGSLRVKQQTYLDDQGEEANGAWNTGIYGARITPQDGAKKTGEVYADASPYNYLIFYIKDTTAGAGSNVHAVFKDADGAIWDTASVDSVKTLSNQWVKMIVRLDRTKLDFSRLTEIQLGTYWGYGNVYYYDDLYLAQSESDASPAYVPDSTALFNDFEDGTGFAAGSGATVTTAADTANAAETTSVLLTTGASGWPYVNNTYLRAKPKHGTVFDASGYNYLMFYIKDTNGSNGAEIRLLDADGGVLDKWGATSSVKNKWVKMILPLEGATSVDLSKIVAVDIGQYNEGSYYIDDIYFARGEDDILPGFIGENENIGSLWYQSFETKGQDGKYGLTAGSGVQTSVNAEQSASAYGSFSLKAVLSADSGDPATNGLTIRPQALGSSIDKTKPYDYVPEIDATNFSHLIFYLRDEHGGQTPRVQLTDGNGKTIEGTPNGQTSAGVWTRISVPLDKTENFGFSRLARITITPQKAGVYYFDEFYLGKSATDDFPNAGYTQLSLKDVDGEAMPFMNGLPLGSFEKQKDRAYLTLNGAWKKQRAKLDSKLSATPRTAERLEALETEADGRQETGFDDSGWTTKMLPMPEDEIGTYESLNGPENKEDKSGYQDGVYYRKHFIVDDSLSGKPARLSFLGVNYFADVWINGQYVGGHQGGYTPFALDVGSALRYGGDNVIVVRVDNPKWDTFANGEILPYAKSDWFNYTGILRDVYLEFLPDVYVVRGDVRTLNTDGDLMLRAFLDNTSAANEQVSLKYTVYEANITDGNKLSEYASDLAGRIAVATATASLSVASGEQAIDTARIRVPEPKLWSPAHPNLYVLKVEQISGGEVRDTFYTQFGIRTLDTDGVQIKLNGELAPFLAGVGYTEDSADKGPSLDSATRYGDLIKIKEDLKANFIRTGHFPHALPTYLYSDRIGLAVWQEIPAYWFSGEAFDLQRQRGQAKQMLEEMIYSNYNRPSVWFDGVSNESAGQLQRVNYIAELRDTAHAIDGTRLVGQSAVANPYKGESDHSHSAADVIGMTMYFGAFYGANTDSETQEEIERIHALYPDKPIIATEYGYWSGDESPSDTKQLKLFTGTFNAFARTATVSEDGSANSSGLLSGAAWWTAYNWYTNITGLQTMGLYHMDRKTPKQVTDVLAERYNRYNRIATGSTPHPVGISEWFQSFESGKGFMASDHRVTLESAMDSPEGGAAKSLKIEAGSNAEGAYAAFVPQGGAINANLSVYNVLNFYAKDTTGNRQLTVTLADADGRVWTTRTAENTVKDVWTRLSVSLEGAQGVPLSARRLNTMAITELRIELQANDRLLVDDAYVSTYKSDSKPPAYPVGSSGWFQSFEEENASVTQGMNAVATVDRTFGVNPGGHGSVKLEVKGDGGSPGANGQSVNIVPQGGLSSVDASDFNYLVFYVKDMQGSNTIHVTFLDTDGTVSTDNWTDVASVKGQWTKVYIPLSKTSADIRKLKEIRLAEWNPGTYYFDDLYFAEYPSDEIPSTYTETIPEKPLPSGQIKVAAIGDSITAGAGLDFPGTTSYPAQLQSLLGNGYAVKNFGVSGRTLLKSGDQPYWNETAFEASKNYAPDIVIIQLGTNDTKSWNWKNGENSFLADYKEMIGAYRSLPSHPQVFVNLPPQVFNEDPNAAYGIVGSVLRSGVIPLIKRAAQEAGATVIDVYAATSDLGFSFPDKVHPNAAGAWAIANTVAKAVKGQVGEAGETTVCQWKDCKAAAYTIVYDDGIYDSVLRFAELHKKYGLVGTLALISGWIRDGYNDMGASTGTWEQWKKLLDEGYFDVASHTDTHRNLTTLTPQEMKTELNASADAIAANTGHVPQALALPYNAFNDAVVQEASKQYVVARQGGNNAGNAPDTKKYYSLYSMLPESSTTVKQLNDWLDFGIAKANWLILTGHGNNGEGWSSPNLGLYDNHYAYVKERSDAVWNGTLAEVGKYLKERQNAVVDTYRINDRSFKVTISGTLDQSAYDEPLTLRTTVPTDWNDVIVTSNGVAIALQPIKEGGGAFVSYEAVPGDGAILVERKTDAPGPGASSGTGNGVAATQKAVLQPDSDAVRKAIDAAVPNADGRRTISFEIKAEAGARAYEIRLPAHYLIGEGKLSIEVTTPMGQLTLPGDMFAGYGAEGAQILSVTVALGDLEGATASVAEAVGNHPVISLNAAIDGNPVTWNSKSSSVSFRMAYRPSAEEILHPERLTFRHLSEDGQKAEPVTSGHYDKLSGQMRFTTHHFSRYAIVNATKTFGDLERYGWALQAIESLASKGIVNGTGSSKFAPAAAITRADAVVSIMRALNLQAERTSSFTDVKSGSYYDEAVHAAKALGIVNGTGGGEFKPNSIVTRQEMMVMMARAMSAANGEIAEGSAQIVQSYKDKATISDYARPSVESLLSAGIFQGSNGYLRPNSSLTRAEAATALYKLYNLYYRNF